jgi:4-amino-4-deoxy-L-arabinose transferase-like glycosyltransferase
MVSRWALDANIMPFFILLGIYTMTRALEQNASRRWIVFSLIPWGLALYAYVMAVIVLPIILALVLVFYWKTLLENFRTWLAGAIVFAVIVFPMALFLIKNFVVHHTMGIERFLPFGIPLLLTTRLQTVASPIPGRWVDTFFFILSGFQEGDYHDSIIGHSPIFLIFLPLCLVGAAFWIRELRRGKRAELFLFWLLGSLPILFLVDANVHRFNSIILPMLVASAYGLAKLGDALSAVPSARKMFFLGAGALIGLEVVLFAWDYFLVLPGVPEFQSAWAANYDRAIATGLTDAPSSDPILLQPGLEFSHIFVLFYTSYPPAQFQHEVNYTLQYSEYWVRSFGRFYIGVNNLPDPHGTFSYILGKWVPDPCPNPIRFWETRLWKVGRCKPPA